MSILLSTLDLLHYAKLFKIDLVEVLSKDLFDDIKPKIGNYIINLQDYYDGQGSHWTTLIIKKDMAIYYDSYGIVPPRSIINFIKRLNKNIKFYYSLDQIQHKDSQLCGYFCLYFLYFVTVLHKKCTKYRYLLNKHNKIFSLENKLLNDKILQKLIKNIYILMKEKNNNIIQ